MPNSGWLNESAVRSLYVLSPAWPFFGVLGARGGLGNNPKEVAYQCVLFHRFSLDTDSQTYVCDSIALPHY